jgi:thioredoxin-like negative regulator of GroEL
MRATLFAAVLVAAPVAVGAGCKPTAAVTQNPAFADAKQPIVVYERLERLIDEGKDSKKDREDAYRHVQTLDDGTAAYLFARAAIAGRLAEKRGAEAGLLVTEAEDFVRRARAIEPDLLEGSATRLLGSLYVLAPGRLLRHGDSETGLELLEEEVKAHPDRLISRLRLAEAYIALGDPDPAKEHLCMVKAGEATLSNGDKKLLAKLFADGGEPECPAAAPAATEPAAAAPAAPTE